ncbi:MAG: restriction endonuclease [Comamonas sp.]|nr:restriction endonuclease [Comamonas sp.]
MVIPDYESLMLPLLMRLEDGRERVLKDLQQELADEFRLTDEERMQLLPSGATLTFASRMGWAKTYLKKAGLVSQPRRGDVQITERGKEALAQKPARIDVKFLEQYADFMEFRSGAKAKEGTEHEQANTALASDLTPDEIMESAYLKSRSALADEVLERIAGCSPAFFERLVVQLLIKMGYGGSRDEAGRAVGRSGDGGIDGVINEDRLGLDAIYLQAKRWGNGVGRPEIQQFVGALAGQRASKGVFITTSRFTQEARSYAANSQYKVVLVDGERLADLMIDNELGVSVIANYPIKRIDSDFFAEE